VTTQDSAQLKMAKNPASKPGARTVIERPISQLGVGDLHGMSAGKIRLQFLAQRLHALGHKPLFHFLDESNIELAKAGRATAAA
jgi:hypothetical protein